MSGFDWNKATPAERDDYARKRAFDQARAQGLPDLIDDPVLLDRVHRLYSEWWHERQRRQDGRPRMPDIGPYKP